jgi:hypothetical protein
MVNDAGLLTMSSMETIQYFFDIGDGAMEDQFIKAFLNLRFLC